MLRRGYVRSSIYFGINSIWFCARESEVREVNSEIHRGISLMRLQERKITLILSLCFLS